MKLAAVAAIFLLGVGAPAWAEDCNLRATASSAQRSYDPFSASNTVLDVNVAVRNDGGKACEAKFNIAPVDGSLSLSSGTDRIIYQIEGARGGGSANAYGPFLIQVPAGATETLPIRFTLPPQQVVPRGAYQSELVLQGVGAGGAPLEVSGGAVILRVQVPARVELSISGTSSPALSEARLAPASINFGDAQSGQTERVYVNVWANSSVGISLESANGGRLLLVGYNGLPPILYGVRFDGTATSLSSPVTLQRTPPASIIGASYELAVTLGDLGGRFAGQYKDVITVTANEN